MRVPGGYTRGSYDFPKEDILIGANFSRLSLSGFLVGQFTFLPSAARAMAPQHPNSAAGAAVAGTMILFVLVFAARAYVFFVLAPQTIPTKTGTANPRLAWIPIANAFLMLTIAKKPMSWFILFLIPLVNIVIAVMVWMGIAEARQKRNWWGILMIVPIANLVVPGYLAWAD